MTPTVETGAFFNASTYPIQPKPNAIPAAMAQSVARRPPEERFRMGRSSSAEVRNLKKATATDAKPVSVKLFANHGAIPEQIAATTIIIVAETVLIDLISSMDLGPAC